MKKYGKACSNKIESAFRYGAAHYLKQLNTPEVMWRKFRSTHNTIIYIRYVLRDAIEQEE